MIFSQISTCNYYLLAKLLIFENITVEAAENTLSRRQGKYYLFYQCLYYSIPHAFISEFSLSQLLLFQLSLMRLLSVYNAGDGGVQVCGAFSRQ